MVTKKTITCIGALVTSLAAATFGWCVYTGKLPIDSTPEEMAKRYQEKKISINDEFLPSYAKMTHIGVEKFVADSARDFDADGINDPYFLCKDGAILARLSKNPDNRPFHVAGTTFYPNFWYDLGKQ